jgi:GT2 family glycosyltransferase
VSKQKIVLLGMMTKIPVAGVIWQTLHYLVGLERLGYETYYVEAHARTPSMLMEHSDDDGSGRAAAFIAGALERFGFGDRWAYHALHHDGRCYGLSENQLMALYRSAALIINLHGGTEPRPEHIATDRLVYLETDPVEVEIQLAAGRQETVDYLRPHCAYFTFGENYGRPDCLLPVSAQFQIRPTRQPVVLDFWEGRDTPGERYTTVGNWRQQWREIQLAGETYSWSKHHEFLKFLDVPSRTGRQFELALAGCEADDRTLLERHGWRVREALPLSQNIDIYRQYICGSRGEFTVAKDQNVRLRTGWFSDRAATYLAAGRPVVTQDTGFGNLLPTGEGLFAFSTLDDIVASIELIEADYLQHSRAAEQIAREYFDAGRVLGRLLQEVGMPRIPPSLVIALSSRRPTTLPPESVRTVLDTPLPVSLSPVSEKPVTSVVVVTRDGLVFTRLCLESVLGSLDAAAIELIVVDNGSTDGTLDYLRRLSERDGRVRVISNGRNAGFAVAVNQGLAGALGRSFVVLNNDTIVPPRSLARLVRHLEDQGLGLVGPVSNEAATEAEIDVSYATYNELLEATENRSKIHMDHVIDVPMLTMFCVALRREVYQRVGPLDERFELALFEDDDYSLRIRRAGYKVACAEDVFVHHFGEGSLGALVPTGEHASLFEANRRRFEEKWATQWEPHDRRQTDDYRRTILRIREMVRESVPAGANVLVVSKGDEELLQLDGRLGAHFPQVEGGIYAGHHPANSTEAIAELEKLHSAGADFVVVPSTSLWWLDYYGALRIYLEECGSIARSEDCAIYRLGSRTRLTAASDVTSR